jgi:hypothetical protein
MSRINELSTLAGQGNSAAWIELKSLAMEGNADAKYAFSWLPDPALATYPELPT